MGISLLKNRFRVYRLKPDRQENRETNPQGRALVPIGNTRVPKAC
jgi:hypothetical protein